MEVSTNQCLLSFSIYLELLWTAPELLREPDPPHKGTHKGDIYAYAIILQEIVLRTGPYGEIQLEPVGKLSMI